MHQAGDLVQAQALYLEILQSQPEHADVLHNMGLLALQVNQPAVGLAHLRQAIDKSPSNPKFWQSYIDALCQGGHHELAQHVFAQAQTAVGLRNDNISPLHQPDSNATSEQALIVCYHQQAYADCEQLARRMLIDNPDQGHLWKWLGLSLQHQQRLDDALQALQKACELLPEEGEIHGLYAAALHTANRLENAVALYRHAHRLDPGNAAYLGNIGVILHNLGKYAEAEHYFKSAIALNPDAIATLINLAMTLQAQNRSDEAERYLRAAISLQPECPETHHVLSIALKAQGRLEEAMLSSQRTLALNPHYAEAHDTLGAILFAQGRFEAAQNCFSRAIASAPDQPKFYNNLGTVLQLQRQLAEAEVYYRKAITLAPDFIDAHTNLGITLQAQGRIEEAEHCWRTSLRLNPESIINQSGLLFHLNYSAILPSSTYVEEAAKFGRMAISRVEQPFTSWLCEPQPQRLRVGLVSGDFRNHPVGHFLHGLLREIGNTHLDVIAYATQPGTDEFSLRIRPYFADWKNIGGLSDVAAAKLIHDDGIHILIDVAGHSSHNRLSMFAWKPAPIQVSWLGYLATTGLKSIDYVLSDPYSIEPADERFFTEAIRRLPDSCICFTPTVDNVAIGPLPAIKQGFITFGSFNNLSKMSDAVVELWSQILHAVPHSRLLLKASQLSEAAIIERTQIRYAEQGIASNRLILAKPLSDPAEHLATYNQIDIALDTFPYPGVTTSVEALWMGVPVLTLRGDGILARACESINHNAGLADWIAADQAEYLQKAANFAENLTYLSRLRNELRSKVLASPLFDSVSFARNFDNALRDIWRDHCTSKPHANP